MKKKLFEEKLLTVLLISDITTIITVSKKVEILNIISLVYLLTAKNFILIVGLACWAVY